MKTTLTVFALFILTVNLFSQWQLTNGLGTAYVNVIRNIHDTLYAGTDHSAYRSTNNGDTWIQINNGLPSDPKVWGLSFTDSLLYAAVYPEPRIYFSTNRGNQWLPTSNYPSTSSWSRNVTASNGYLFAGTDAYTYSSTNNGSNWIEMAVGSFYPYNTSSIIVKNSQIFAADRGDGVAVTFLGGTSWTWVNNGLNNQFVYDLSANSDRIFAATRGGIYSTTNSGSNWLSLNPLLTSTYVYSLITINTNILIGTQQNVYYSSNNGTDWTTISTGLPGSSPNIYALGFNNTHLFAGLSSGAIYRRPISEIIGIQPISSEVPKQFSLSQNYPNPFNPVTNINFNVKEKGLVKLTVFNSIGQEVAVILNQELSPGTYNADWNAADYSSGVYYYKITVGNYTETKKMILIK